MSLSSRVDPESLLESESRDPSSGKWGPENDIWKFISVFFLYKFSRKGGGGGGGASDFKNE